MEEYAGRVLADRYRLPLPPSDEYELTESRAFDTYSGQEVVVRQVPLPEVVEAEVLDAEGLPDGFTARDRQARRPARGGTRRPADPAVRRAVEAAQAAAQIPDHPRLDQVFDVFAEGGSLWIVSEAVPARPLAALLAEQPLTPYRAAEVASDVLMALRVLHAHGWVHRNVTARTVLVCDDGRVMLTGLAVGAAEEALCGYDPVPPPEAPPGEDPADGPGGPGPGVRTAQASGDDAEAARRAAIDARTAGGLPPATGADQGDGRTAGGAPAPSAPESGGDIRAARAGAIAAYRAGARAAARVQESQQQGRPALPGARPAPDGDPGAPPYGHGAALPPGAGDARGQEYDHGAALPPGADQAGGQYGNHEDRTGGQYGDRADQSGGQPYGSGADQPGAQPYGNGRHTDPSGAQPYGNGRHADQSGGQPYGNGHRGDQTGGQPYGRGGALPPAAGDAGRGDGGVESYGSGDERSSRPGSGAQPGAQAAGRAADPYAVADPYGVAGARGGRTGSWHGATPRGGPGATGDGGAVPPAAPGTPRYGVPQAPGAPLPGLGAAPASGVPGQNTGDPDSPASGPRSPGGPRPYPAVTGASHGTPALPPSGGSTDAGAAGPPAHWDDLVSATVPAPRRGPATALAAERARQARMAVVGPVTERWAPEQAVPVHENWQLAAPIGPATDLWALGALLYRAVQGHAPYPEESTAELVQMVCSEPPAFAEECGPLRPVVESLLRQDPTDRLDFEELRGWLRSLVRSAPEPDAGVHLVAAPPVDISRLPVVRRRGELVRRRRAGLPATTAHGRHKRGRQEEGSPRKLGRNLLLLVLLLLAGAVAYAMVFMPKADQEGTGRGAKGGAAGEASPGPERSSASTEPSSGESAPQGGPSPSRSGGATETQTDGAAPGFTLRKDSTGFQIAVAKGWTRTPKNGSGQVVYSHGDFELIVVPGRDSAQSYGGAPMDYQRDDERELQPYRDSSWATATGLKEIQVGGRTMAEGQFTWTDDSGHDLYVRNLAILIAGRYHVVQVRGPESERDEVTRLYEQASQTYEVTG
ncbi:protein kinase [Streptomyces sp. NPDC101249]|uniref:protein kinase n=1 Tax=Streptomyces sp. NPDC101249 TaxID=3366140 RepID=UPI0037F17520